MAIRPATTVSLKIMIPLIGLSFWTGTTYMMVLNLAERQTAIETKMEKDAEQRQVRDSAINDKLGDIKSEVAVMNGNVELINRRMEKNRRY